MLACTCDQNEKASLHVIQVDGVIFDLNGTGFAGASVLLWQQLTEPLLNEPHLKHPINFLIENV